MALPGSTHPSPQVIGSAFVQQYYFVLHQSPDQVHRFYEDSSILSRLDSNGLMTSVTTMQEINEKVLSMDFSNYIAEIESADSQPSYQKGVLVAVTGSLTGRDNNIKRKFTQTFFLAPQEKGGYVVLNDIFRFVDTVQSRDLNQGVVNDTDGDVSTPPLTPEPEPALVQESHAANSVEREILNSVNDTDNGDDVVKPSENEPSEGSDVVVADPEILSSQPVDQRVSEAAPSVSQEDEPKKSYASIVKVYKASPSPAPSSTPVSKQKVPLPKATPPKPDGANPEKQNASSSKTSSTFEISVTSDTVPENDSNDVEGHSVYIRNLPLGTTPEHVEEEFKKFGPIKAGGVQVRNHKVESFCFGFVEFESLDSMQGAIKASPISIGGRHAFIEEKRTTTRVVNGVVMNGGNINGGRGRFLPRGGSYRGDNFRGRGGYGGNQGYVGNQGFGRADFRTRGEYSGRGRGGLGRPINNYQQRPFQNGNARMFRPMMGNQTAIST